MKTVSLSALALAALLGTAASAHASTVNFTGNQWDFGTVAIGQNGTVTTSPNNTYVVDMVGNPLTSYYLGYGFLPNDSKITFTYAFNTAPVPGTVHAVGSYSYVAGNSQFTIVNQDGTATEYKTNLFNHLTNTITPPSVLPVVTTAGITGTTGTTTITNTSGSLASFSSYFLALMGSADDILTVTYNVSAVPLPASMILFMTALMAMVGYAAVRRRA